MKAAALNPLPKKLKCCSTCKWLLGAWLLSLGGASWAADISTPPAPGSHTRSEQKEAQKQPPSLPSDAQESDDSRNLPKPEVRIIHEKDKTIEEYRVGGMVRYVKITPKHGKPYYLVDRNGDGIPDTYYDPMKGPPPINQWLLLKW
ncbi:MAG: DUF2782 domain-containing protein [Gammaproteobacteria bacterium]|nr:DUF2782 domain-containing protein [Gammaproteobacteria bacterium]